MTGSPEYFLMLEQLFQLEKIVLRSKKIFRKKIVQVGSYFENFVSRNTVMQSNFDLDIILENITV